MYDRSDLGPVHNRHQRLAHPDLSPLAVAEGRRKVLEMLRETVKVAIDARDDGAAAAAAAADVLQRLGMWRRLSSRRFLAHRHDCQVYETRPIWSSQNRRRLPQAANP